MIASTERATRRGFLAGLAGGIAAFAAALMHPGAVVEAAAGDPVKAGRTTVAGAASTILATSAAGDGLRVAQAGKGPALVGQTTIATGESIAVKGVAASSGGIAVHGRATAKTGGTRGVEGITDSAEGFGVEGWATSSKGRAWGINGVSDSVEGLGVRGAARATSGSTIGVIGSSASPAGVGVEGWASATSGDTVGVYGLNDSTGGQAVKGWARAKTGVTYAVLGNVDSAAGYGVVGWARSTTGETNAIWGLVDSPDGWAGRFTSKAGNGVYISVPAGKAGLNVAAGTKNAVVATSDGARLLYAEEATEVLFCDYGFGRLVDGEAEVAIDPVFRETLEPGQRYHVFVQPYGEAELWVTDRRADGFTVRGRGPERDAEFSYRIVARRAGYGDTRLERAPWADSDVNLAGVR